MGNTTVAYRKVIRYVNVLDRKYQRMGGCTGSADDHRTGKSLWATIIFYLHMPRLLVVQYHCSPDEPTAGTVNSDDETMACVYLISNKPEFSKVLVSSSREWFTPRSI
ncbi:hypothetical protein FRC19_001092 [Serendipita sp. 401]|nr:hypothetical protein FRC19_001092 [Serendipita sp. 401]